MARKIEIEEDVYQYLASQTQEIGESASSILRRLLGLSATQPEPEAPPAQSTPIASGHEFSALIGTVGFRQANGVSRFLAILEEAFRQRPNQVEAVFQVQGKKRLYFGRSAREIEASGSSTAPKRVGQSSVWVTTNTSSSLKGEILDRTLRAMGFSAGACNAANRACIEN